MNVHLIIGASGLVGNCLMNEALMLGLSGFGTFYNFHLPGLQGLDVRDRISVFSLIEKVCPSVVYLPASLTDVNRCEQNPSEGYATNVIGVSHVVDAANHVGAKLVYFSSDYVFDGRSGPYVETDLPNPICEYGRQKLIAEHYISIYAKNYLIVRTTVVYGWEHQGKNFVCRLLEKLGASQATGVPVDQIGSPTYAPNLARVVVELAQLDSKGIYHVVGPARASRYEFACEVARVFGMSMELIYPLKTRDLNQVAPRPLNAGMVASKVSSKLNAPLLGFKEGLLEMLLSREVK